MGYYSIKDYLNRVKRSADKNDQYQYPPQLTDMSFSAVQKYIEDVKKYYSHHGQDLDLLDDNMKNRLWIFNTPYDSNHNRDEYTYHPAGGDYTYNLNGNYKEHQGPRVLFIFLGVILVGILLFALLYTYFKCSQKTATVPPNNSLQNAPQSITTNNNGLLPGRQNLSAQNRNGNTRSDFVRPLVTNTNRNSNHLDLPPSYANSTDNSRNNSLHSVHDTNNGAARISNSNKNDVCVLPPSYEEAVANVVPSAPVCETNVAPTAPVCDNYTSTCSN